MSYEYEEVINLIVKTDQMNAQLQAAKRLFEAAKADLELTGIKAELKVEDFIIDLKKLEVEKLKSEERSAKEAARVKEREAKVAAARLIKDKKAEIKDLAAMQAEADKAIAQQDAAQAKQELLEAKELHRYRKEGDLLLHRARMQQIRDEAAQAKQAAQFNSIFAPGGRPLGITSGAPASAAPAAGGVNISAIARAGAGGAGALGAYPAAGALYASANALQALGMSTVSATAALTVFAPALAAVGAVFVAYKFVEWGAEFSRELARMSTLMLSTKASAEEFSATLDRTAQSALKISSTFNMEAVDVVRAFKEALSSGIDASDLERFITTAAKLATATASTLQQTTTLLTSIKDSYGLSIGEMTHQSDLLFNTINVGKIQMKDFVNGFARVAEAGAAAGISIEQLDVAIAGVTRVGVPTARAMTAMVSFIHAIEHPSTQAAKAMTEMGIAFGDSALRGRDIIDVVKDIEKATQGGVGSKIAEIFDDSKAREFIKAAIKSKNIMQNEIIPGMKDMETSAVASSRAMNNLSDDIGKMMTTMSNAITSKSHAAGTVLHNIIFGSAEEQAAHEKKLLDRVEKMRAIARSAVERGFTADAAERNAAVIGMPTIEESKGNVFDFVAKVKEHAAAAKIAVQQAFDGIKDTAVQSIRGIEEELEKVVRDTSTLLDKLAAPLELTKMTKVDTKELNSRATDEQKQKLLDLADELEDEKSILAEKKKQLAIDMEARQIAFTSSTIRPIEDQINSAMQEGGDKGTIPGLQVKLNEAKKEFTKFAEAAKEELTNTDVFNPFLAKIFDLTITIETMRARIRGQDTNKDRKDKEDAEKKATAAAKKEIESFNNVAERLYREDVTAYEKAQRDRAGIFKKINKEMEKEGKRSSEIIANAQNNILKSKLDAKKDDPSAQGRIARGARDQALEELKRASAGGKSNDFESALKKFDAASSAAKDAMSQIDDRRAQRVYQEDQSTVIEQRAEFDKNYTDAANGKAMGMSQRDSSVSIRGPQQIARDAAKEVQANKEITKVVLDVTAKLQIDGELSEKTKQDLTTQIIDKVKQSWSNRNPPPSTYDPVRRTSRSVVSPDDE